MHTVSKVAVVSHLETGILNLRSLLYTYGCISIYGSWFLRQPELYSIELG